MSSSSGAAATSDIQHIGRAEMEEILEDYEAGGREDSQYIVVDVRTGGEIANTGKLSPSVHCVPIEVIMEHNVFQLDEDDFEEVCGFAKPMPDETLVFTCAAGVRSVYACQFAAQAGYSKLVNYVGGSNDWFQPPRGF
jgi:rhodanese-related sulfurtransferase